MRKATERWAAPRRRAPARANGDARPGSEHGGPVGMGVFSRRQILKALGGGMLVVVGVPASVCSGKPANQARAGESGRQGRTGQDTAREIAAWLHIAPDGRITAYSGKVEVGQNARTSLSQAVAEELRVPLASVTMVLGDTDLCPFDQGTFGSRTTPAMLPILRRAAASAREALIEIAAKRLGVSRDELRAEDGRVFKASPAGSGGARPADPANFSYGELAKELPPDAALREVALTAPSEWKTLGTSAPKSTGLDIVTGRHRYPSDIRREGMLYAKVLRPPSLGATLVSVETGRAKTLEGVRVVEDGSFVAVAAPTLRLAERALMEIEAEWKESPAPSNSELFELLRPGRGAAGGTERATTYTCQYIAHAPLEPRAAVAEWDGNRMTVYTGTQRPFGVRAEVARALGVPEERVRVIVPDTGSGYGGKHTGDAAVEAARIARAVGRPVKLVWTRQEEFMFAYFRPAGLIEISAEVGPDGRISSWQHVNYNSGGAGIGCPYAVPNPRTQSLSARSPLRQGSYRALAATFNNFARESYVDELAHAAGIDPLEFRLRNLRDERLSAVLKAVAERFGWPKKASASGIGLACGVEREATSPPAWRSGRIARQGGSRCCARCRRSSAALS